MSATNPPVQLGPTYGAELLATFVTVALWGTTCMQTLLYFIRYPKDRLVLKSLVVWLWLANTAHELLLVKAVYDSLIVHFCSYHRIATVVPEYLAGVVLTSVVSVTAQTFFTYRISRFTGERWVYWAILVPVCLFELGGSLAFVAFGVIVSTATQLVLPVPSSIYIAIHAVAAGADLTIAAGMVVLLLQSQEHALKGTRSVIQKLLFLTINTGIWTALFAVFTFVAMIVSKSTLVYVAAYFPLCPLYCNTVLANLNAREFLNMSSMVTESGTIENAYHLGPVFANPPSTVKMQSMDPKLTVQVEVSKSVRVDDEQAPRPRGKKLDMERE